MLKVESNFQSAAERVVSSADGASGTGGTDTLCRLRSVHVDDERVEHHVCADSTRVVWCAGAVLQRVFTAPSPVEQVLWVRFGDVADWPVSGRGASSASSSPHSREASAVAALPLDLCIVHRDGILVHTVHGLLYALVAPCPVRRLWALPLGVLLERASAAGASVERDTPMMFSLLHPLDEFKPLSFANVLSSLAAASGVPQTPDVAAASSSIDLFCDELYEIVFASALVPLIVTQHRVRGHTTFWLLRKRVAIGAKLTYERARARHSTARGNRTAPGSAARTASFLDTSDARHPMHAAGAPLSTRSDMTSFVADDDDAIVSELLLDAVHTEEHRCWDGADLSSNAALCNDADGSVLLCLVNAAQRRLRAFRLVLTDGDAPIDGFDGTESLSLACAFAVDGVVSCAASTAAEALFGEKLAHSATRRFGDLVLLRDAPAPAIELCLGATVLLHVPLASVAPLNGVRALADAARNSFRVLTASAQLSHRLTLTAAPEPGLTLRSLCALRFVLPLPSVMALAVAVVNGADSSASEWQRFAAALDTALLAGGSLDASVQIEFASNETELNQLDSEQALLDAPAPGDDALSGTDADWQAFLRECRTSGDVALSMLTRQPPAAEAGATPKPPVDGGTCARVLSALHLVYEDAKLSTLYRTQLLSMANLLSRLAASIGWRAYHEHYARDFPQAVVPFDASLPQVGAAPPVPSIIDALGKRMARSGDGALFPTLAQLHASAVGAAPFVDPCRQTALVWRMYAILTSADEPRVSAAPKEAPRTPHDAQSSRLGTKRFRAPLFTTPGSFPASPGGPPLVAAASALAPAAALTVEQELVEFLVRSNVTLDALDCVPLGVVLPVREAIGRCRAAPPADWSAAAYRLIGRPDLVMDVDPDVSKRQRLDAEAHVMHTSDGALDVRDVSGGLVAQASEDSLESKRLAANAPGELRQRVCELRFGRDRRLVDVTRLLSISHQVTLRTASAGAGVADHDQVQEQQAALLQFAMRTLALSVGRGMYTYATAAASAAEPITRPKFLLDGRVHGSNATVMLENGSVPADFGRWPNFHNGAASALRLMRNSAVVTSPWIVFNKPASELTSSYSGSLLALGLTGQLSVLALTKVYDYLAIGHDMTSVAILIGMAASQRGTMHVDIAKLLAIHIPSLHASTSTDLEVPASLQTAALIGVGLLYQATCHRHMTEVLLEEIGRRAVEERHFDRESYALSAGLSLGFVALGSGRHASLADLKLVDRLARYIDGGVAPHVSGAALLPPQSSLIAEGARVNTDLTAPAATIALGLMFLRTNDAEVAARLALPQSRFLFDFVRADFATLRVLAHSLVLWDAIEPSDAWLASRLPRFMQPMLALVVADAAAAAAVADDDENGTAAKADIVGAAAPKSGQPDDGMLRDASAFALAGGCLALGLRYAGSARRDASELLLRHVRRFERLARVGGGAGAVVSRRCAEHCLGACAMALGCVLAGTGNLEALKVLRELRARVGAELTYGNHMAISMAIGLLFLGGGCATLGTSNAAIASLVAALYPRMPQTPTDNMAHLQALRHFYVMAIEERLVEVRDVDTGAPCYAPLEVDVVGSDGNVYTLARTAPCLLPDYATVRRVRVTGDRYLSRELPPGALQRARVEPLVLHVKRKAGFLAYDVDPRGQRSILARSLPKPGAGAASHDEFVRAFSAEPDVIGFAHNMCAERGARSAYAARHAAFCAGVLYECLTREKPAAIALYLALHDAARLVAAAGEGDDAALACSPLAPTLAAADLRLVASYYRARVDEPLIDAAFLNRVLARVDAALGDASTHIRTALDQAAAPNLRTATALSYYGVLGAPQLELLKPQLRAALAGVPANVAPTVAVAWLQMCLGSDANRTSFATTVCIAKALLSRPEE
jgi:hypothetical protein